MSFVALSTCREIPEPDPDESLLVEALERAGVPVRVLPWDDESVDWTAPRLTVMRSTWNYYLRPDAFLRWASAQGDRLMNPPGVVAWNHHKRYLFELEMAGVRTVPGIGLMKRSHIPYSRCFSSWGWTDVVVKPCVSAGSYETVRLKSPPFDDALLQAIVDTRDTMMQPFVASVETYGERAVVFIDGELTHAVRKSPRFSDGQEVVSDVVPCSPTTQRELAAIVLAHKAVAGPLLYARVDVMRDAEGRPMLSELELIEPSLFLRQSPPALERFTAAIARHFRARGSSGAGTE